MPDTIDAPASDSSSEEIVDSAINADSQPQQLDTAKHVAPEPVIESNPHGPIVTKAIEKLAGIEKDKPEDKVLPTEPKEKIPTKDEPKADPKKDDPLKDFSDVERKQLSQKTQRRIQELWKAAKENETKLTTSREYQYGSFLSNAIDDFGVGEYAETIQPDQIAGAISFQGALNKMIQGKATDNDKQLLSKFYNTFYDEGVKLGFLNKQESNQPAIDPTPIKAGISAALAKLAQDYDVAAFMATVESSLATLKAPEKKPEQPEKKDAPRQVDQIPQSQQPSNDARAEGLFYSKKLAKEAAFLGDEAKDMSALYNRLEAMAVDEIRKSFPGMNPKQYYTSLSIPSRFELLKDQLASIKESRASQTPAKVMNTERPVQTTPVRKQTPSSSPIANAVNALENWGQ